MVVIVTKAYYKRGAARRRAWTGLSKEEAARQWERHLGAMRAAAWRFAARNSRHSYEELFAEASGRLFMRAAETYRVGRGAEFGTWLWHVVRNGLGDHVRRADPVREAVHGVPPGADPDKALERVAGADCPVPGARLRWREWLAGLGAEARAVAGLALNAPEELAAALGVTGGESPHRLRRALRRYLQERRGWGRARVDAAWAEVAAALEKGA